MTTDGSLSLRGYDRPPSFAFPRQRRVPRCPRLEVKPSPLRSIKITREEKAPEHVRVFPSWTVLLDLEKIAKGVKKKKNLDRENSPKREKPNGCYKLTGHFRSITPRMTQVELFYSDSTKKKKDSPWWAWSSMGSYPTCSRSLFYGFFLDSTRPETLNLTISALRPVN